MSGSVHITKVGWESFMPELKIVQPDPSLRPFVEAVAVRMADEGIPVRAIARTTRLSSDDIYEVLRSAIDRGIITQLPKDDWTAGTQRTDRNPFIGSGLEDEEVLKVACARRFKTTRLESSMLAVMLKRREVTKQQLHLVIEQNRDNNRDPTDPKMVDVIICKLRKKLKPYDIEVGTIWGIGYLLEAGAREKAIALLQAADLPPLPLKVMEIELPETLVSHG